MQVWLAKLRLLGSIDFLVNILNYQQVFLLICLNVNNNNLQKHFNRKKIGLCLFLMKIVIFMLKREEMVVRRLPRDGQGVSSRKKC